MADVKWIKLSTDLFNNRKIKQIRRLLEGDAIIGVWLQLLCLAGESNTGGLVMFSKDVPYTEEMLVNAFDRDIAIIRLAISTFIAFGMIEIVDNVLCVSNWEKYQSADKLELLREYNRDKKREYRLKQRDRLSLTCPGNVLGSPQTDIDIDKDKDLDKEHIYKAKKTRNKKQTPNEDKNGNPKPSYGYFNNVFLSDEELAKLKADFKDWEDRIERLSDYIQQYPSKGEKYSNHLATIRNWARRDKQEQPKQTEKIEW